jgi:hypothetical protein
MTLGTRLTVGLPGRTGRKGGQRSLQTDGKHQNQGHELTCHCGIVLHLAWLRQISAPGMVIASQFSPCIV